MKCTCGLEKKNKVLEESFQQQRLVLEVVMKKHAHDRVTIREVLEDELNAHLNSGCEDYFRIVESIYRNLDNKGLI